MKFRMPEDYYHNGPLSEFIKQIINSGRVLLYADVKCPRCHRLQSYANCNGSKCIFCGACICCGK